MSLMLINKNIKSNIPFVFFGTPNIAVWVLEELKKGGMLPSLIVTAPDKPQGRKMVLTAPPAKIWAEENDIPVLQPQKLNGDLIQMLSAPQGLTSSHRSPNDSSRTDLSRGYQLFIVAAYGKLIPQAVLDVPKYGTLNVHPSLLPKFRGASPIISAILSDEKETGTTIMVVDEEMDHGPIVKSETMEIGKLKNFELGEKLARLGGQMLVDIIPKWIIGEMNTIEQEHEKATYTKKIIKEDGLIDLDDSPETNNKKFRAYYGWPGTYFFTEKNGEKIRVKITDAELQNKEFVIKRVIPEGKKEMNYKVFL